jgi:hypothetical protein
MPKLKILEKDVRKVIKDWLQFNKWFVFSNFQGLGSYRGVTDFTAIKDGRVLWIEVKTPTGTQHASQVKFQNNIEAVGGEYVLARSSEDVETAIALQQSEDVF